MKTVVFALFGLSTCFTGGFPCSISDAETGDEVSGDASDSTRVNVDCSRRGLTSVPENLPRWTVHLDLHGNDIKEVHPNTSVKFPCNITHLDLSDNDLQILDPEAFGCLHLLETLNLAGNKLCLPTGYPEGVFRDLTALRVLTTYSNQCPTLHQRIPDEVFGDLVSLEKLSLDVCVHFYFGGGFQKLTQLRFLEATSNGKTCEQYEVRVTEESFSHLNKETLTHLTLRGCAFRSLGGFTFAGMVNLQSLNLACCTNLHKSSVFSAIDRMQNASLETFIMDGMTPWVSHVSVWQRVSGFLETHDFCHVNLKNLKRLSVRENSIVQGVTIEKYGVPCLPHLSHINLGPNPLSSVAGFETDDTARKILRDGMPIPNYWTAKNVRTVDISHLLNLVLAHTWWCNATELDGESYFRKVPRVIEDVPYLPDFDTSSGVVKSNASHIDIENFEGLTVGLDVSPGTQVLFADAIAIGDFVDPTVDMQCPFVIYPLDTVAYLNFSRLYPVNLFSCPVLGVRNLKVLDVSFCGLTYFHPQPEICNVELLYFRGNRLNNSQMFPQIFKNATKVRILDLSENRFQSIPFNSFETLGNMEELNLAHNKLKYDLNISISHMTKLKTLNLASNEISRLEAPVRAQLGKLHAKNPKFSVILRDNPLLCDCDSIPFLKWLRTTQVKILGLENIKCPNTTSSILQIKMVIVQKTCPSSYTIYYIVIGSMSGFIVVLLAASCVSYRKRWKIAWHLYVWKRRWARSRNSYGSLTEGDQKTYTYVAYVDYCRENGSSLPWVKNHLISKVENEWSMSLFIFDRDPDPCDTKPHITVEAMNESRKIIFVLTEEYYKSDLWQLVLYGSLQQGMHNIIFCLIDGSNTEQLPQSLARVVHDVQQYHPMNYIMFNDSDCWNRLKHALNAPFLPEDEQTL